MTDEEIERHIGLEQVRNVMEGFDREHGIDKIRRMIHEVRNEDKKPEDEEYESDGSETQRMKRLQWIQDNRKPKNWKRPQKLLKEKIPIYIKRMLFTYKNCGCCKKEMTNLKVLLNNIFPAGICDEICDYNLHCSKCKDLNDRERRYIDFNYHFDYFEDKELTRVEKIIYFFNTRMEKSPIYLSNTNRTNVRTMKKEIDDLMDTYKLKQ